MSNLLPQAQKKQITRLYRLRFIGVALGALSILGVAGLLLLSPTLLFLKNTQAALLAKKNSFAGKETSGLQGSLITALSDINARLAAFIDPAPASPLVHSFIDPVLTAKTSAVSFTDFYFTKNTANNTSADIRVSGVADSREALLTFAGNLGKINGVTNVTVPITSFLKNSDVLFTVSATITLQ